MNSAKSKKNRNSDGYKRKNLLSAMDKPGENIAMLSKELKKLAAFMRNTDSETEKVEKIATTELKEKKDDNFSTIDNFLESSGIEESSLDDILKSEGYSSDYFTFTEEEPIDEDDKQIDSINSFLSAVESGVFSKPEREDSTEEEIIDNLNEEEYNRPIEEEFLTESLAHIYIKQRKYERALEIIKEISLKNPEKNIYFADQIRFLEKLIINIKTE
ncbi:MAG: hypothetical protein IKK64_06215 [Bacteroidales bacterium]|nr:hypothetical protein [Bacteroidales bacterium]